MSEKVKITFGDGQNLLQQFVEIGIVPSSTEIKNLQQCNNSLVVLNNLKILTGKEYERAIIRLSKIVGAVLNSVKNKPLL